MPLQVKVTHNGVRDMIDEFVCMHTEGTYVTADGLNCAACGMRLCSHDEYNKANEQTDDMEETSRQAHEYADIMHA